MGSPSTHDGIHTLSVNSGEIPGVSGAEPFFVPSTGNGFRLGTGTLGFTVNDDPAREWQVTSRQIARSRRNMGRRRRLGG